MMPQMEPGQPINQEPSANYGRYEGNQASYPPPQYETPYQAPQGNIYDDDYVDGLAQRLSQRMAAGPASKIQAGPSGKHRTPDGMRLALAIVSVSILVPLAAILLGAVGGSAGLIGFGVACFAIFLINGAFSGIFNN